MQTNDQHDGPPVYEFGWWPEIFGAALTLSIAVFLMSMARGDF